MPGLRSTYLAHTSFQGPSSWLLTMHSATGSSSWHSGPSSGSGRSDSAKHSATGTRTSAVEEDGAAEPGERFGDVRSSAWLEASRHRAEFAVSMSLTIFLDYVRGDSTASQTRHPDPHHQSTTTTKTTTTTTILGQRTAAATRERARQRYTHLSWLACGQTLVSQFAQDGVNRRTAAISPLANIAHHHDSATATQGNSAVNRRGGRPRPG